MLGHAAELMLKAYLLTPTATQKPMTLSELKGQEYRHDLVALLQAAVGRGLACDAAITKDVGFLSRAHNNYQARYPLVEIEAEGSMPEGPWAVAVEELEGSVKALFDQIKKAVFSRG
jgi:hypothetical protein